MPVYLDLVVLMDFLVDLMLLLAANHICGHRTDLKRCVVAAAVGGVYTGACLLRPFAYLGSLFWRITTLICMGICAFGLNRTAFRRTLAFVLLNLTLGGGILILNTGGFLAVVLGALVLFFLCLYGFGTKAGRKFLPVSVTYNGITRRFFALLDTGNVLKDPISGSNVLVVSPIVAMELVGLTEQQLRDPVLTLMQSGIGGLRLIPFRSVGCNSGMLLAMEFLDVQIGREKGRRIIAFSPNNFGNTAEFQALTGGI